MNLRTRLLLLGCCFLLFQLGILYILFENSIDPKINKLEQGLVEKNLTRSMEVMQRELFHIEHTTQLMSSLPLIKESLTMLSLNQKKSDELVEIMGQQELNLVYILDNNNKVIWGNIIDLNTLQPYPNTPFLPSLWKEKPRFLKPSSQQSLQAGIFTSFLGPILIVSSPILSSDPKKAIAGTLIIGRLITHQVIQLIQTLAFTDMKLWPLEGATLSKKHQAILKQLSQTESNFLVEKNESSFQGYISLSDLSETANLLVSASQNRDFSQTIRKNLIQIGACLIALQLTFMALLSWSIGRRLIVPMKTLINELEDHTYDNQPIDFNKHTWKDLSPLVESLSQFNGRMHNQAASENILAYREGIDFARQELADDLQKLVEPLTRNLVWAEQKLIGLPISDLQQLIAQCQSAGLEHNQMQDLAEQLQRLSDKIQAFQKEIRTKMMELHTHSLHHAAHLRARANSFMSGLG